MSISDVLAMIGLLVGVIGCIRYFVLQDDDLRSMQRYEQRRDAMRRHPSHTEEDDCE